MSKELEIALAEGRAVNIPPLARALGLSRVGLYAAAKRGDFQTTRIGRRVLVPAPVAKQLLGLA